MRPLFVLMLSLFAAWSSAEVELRKGLPEAMIPELQEVISQAFEESSTSQLRRISEQEAEGRRISARSAVLPRLGTSIALRKEDNLDSAADTGFEDRVIYNITLSQPIYHWGARKSEKVIGELQYEIEKLHSQAAYDSLLNRIRSEYLGLVVEKLIWEKEKRDLEKARSDLEYVQAQVDAGTAPSSQLEGVEIELERSEIATLRAEGQYLSKYDAFAEFVSIDPARLDGLIVNEIPAVEPLSSEQIDELRQFLENGVQRDPGLMVRGLNEEIEKRRLKIESQALRPKVDAQLGLSSNALDLDGTRREQEYSYFGLSVGWSIFDGFRKKGRTMEVLNRLNEAQLARENAEVKLRRSLEQSLLKLKLESRALALEERLLRAKEGQVVRVKEDYEGGRRPKGDLERFQREREDVNIRAQSQRAEYLKTLGSVLLELGLDSTPAAN